MCGLIGFVFEPMSFFAPLIMTKNFASPYLNLLNASSCQSPVTKQWQAIADSHHNGTRVILWLCCHLCHLGSCCSSALQILHWETCADRSSSAAFVVLQSSAAWERSTQAMKIYTSLKSIFRWHLRRCDVWEQGPVVVRVDVPFCLNVSDQMRGSCGLFFC